MFIEEEQSYETELLPLNSYVKCKNKEYAATFKVIGVEYPNRYIVETMGKYKTQLSFHGQALYRVHLNKEKKSTSTYLTFSDLIRQRNEQLDTTIGLNLRNMLHSISSGEEGAE